MTRNTTVYHLKAYQPASYTFCLLFLQCLTIGKILAADKFGNPSQTGLQRRSCGGYRYRKFGNLLAQNLRKGSRGLTRLLEQEAEDAFEERKSMARKLGEEAGTKMLFPMILMLGAVMLILAFPAMRSMEL
jgi:hypothetical protein